jgi:transcriptional regulator GlxA family with amidase domain
MPAPLIIALMAFDDCLLLDLAGPASVFGVANTMAGRKAYELKFVSPHGGLATTSCGMSMQTVAPAAVSPRSVDTLLVAGGSTVAMRKCIEPKAMRLWIGRCTLSARRFGSVCSGAFILAELGELDGRKVTSHWQSCDELTRRFPQLSVDANALFVVNGNAWTSAGVCTGIDMALAMVEQDLGRAIADRVARFLVLYARRPGFQSQFSDVLSAQTAGDPQFAELIAWIQTRLPRPIEIAELAGRAGLSERTFYRHFVAATGRTPAQFIQGARLELARTLLLTALPLKTVAARSGLGSTAWLNVAFRRRFGLMPATFRELYRRDAASGR